MMLTFAKVDFAKGLLGKISNDNKATILGVVAAALIGCTQLNWALLLKGDSGQEGIALGAVVVALWGFYTNKPDKKKGDV
ncbi:MAG: hypothetical protein KGL39_11470 [Patescibacteria group bacterium]|nr:hypothetical protein [Patescibacteria group bacterium]